jgi:hypothetical protein
MKFKKIYFINFEKNLNVKKKLFKFLFLNPENLDFDQYFNKTCIN